MVIGDVVDVVLDFIGVSFWILVSLNVRAFVVDFAVLSVIPRFSVSLFVMDLVSVSVIPSRSESCSCNIVTGKQIGRAHV